ncbi:2-oxoadipate dioxygenase/decarboxylase HglS [Advenella mimigardefordensis]|uniref:2-oxoadipate dioxygenase/decarboxylase n=1 Tax=Advenella mimigardefordensis (strain DSM 17166 / LMG 22922 / DPN7) TaxID=1247726 RepID=W0PA85_ADVMD|nr:VOC family protein [Advenella mimigardefordensis]AHG62320.1 hypothetical protein MIM_c02180 [Advenella mimigardefordensis DPN7]
MEHHHFVPTDEIRTRFSTAMSNMYGQEVPLYRNLLELVADVNAQTLQEHPQLQAQLKDSGEIQRLNLERHGAIRLGTAAELSGIRRVFAVMGLQPVGYYDLSVAGVPVHATAFRPVSDASLAANPFRVFTSLLRLELIDDEALRAKAAAILEKRSIFSARVLELVEKFETEGGLSSAHADEFVAQATDIFRWHSEATVSIDTYNALLAAHRLIADVVCFKGPHINHLTPRTLDIDAAQKEMLNRTIPAKESIEGPPTRRHPILLRQTSFKALEESVTFDSGSEKVVGAHTARFGEIEQRGLALTPKGRALYDQLLLRAREARASAGATYAERLEQVFTEFPDDLGTIRKRGLGYFRYSLTQQGRDATARQIAGTDDIDALIDAGLVHAEPIIYEDFLPVSAAGIFQSNLGDDDQKSYQVSAAKAAFEEALGAKVNDEFALYEAAQQRSLEQLTLQLKQ